MRLQIILIIVILIVEMNSELMRDRIKGCLFGLFVADAVASPVHWYYNLNLIK